MVYLARCGPGFLSPKKILLPILLSCRSGFEFDDQSPTTSEYIHDEIDKMTKLKEILKEVLGIALILVTLALILVYFYQVLFSKIY